MTTVSPAPVSAQAQARRPARPGAFDMPLVLIPIAGGLAWVWTQRDEGMLTPEEGLGYALGISGSLLMLALLIYPLRKRIRGLRFLGNVPGWFRLHMILGIIGPALIVVHSNFGLGSFNGRVAMAAMLIVAGSGFIGRFLYGRIHRGLYGRKRSVQDRIDDLVSVRDDLSPASGAADLAAFLARTEARRVRPDAGLLRAFALFMGSVFSHHRLRRQILTTGVVPPAVAADARFRARLDAYFLALAHAEALTFYERLFALWHMLHLPLFVILVAAALGHVYAVHYY